VQPVNDNAVSTLLNSGDISDIPQRTGYLPYLAIAYPTSSVVDAGLATPGEFVLEGKKNLSKKIEVIVADFRLHLSVWNNTTSSTDSDCYARSDDPQRGKSTEYLAYKNQTVPANCKINEGVDLLLWIPIVNSFAVIYLKNTTYDSFAPTYTSGKGGRLVQMSTRPVIAKKSGKKFYVIDSIALDRALVNSPCGAIPGVNITCDITIPNDFAVAAVKKFKEVQSTETAEESVVSDR
jgi:hypothetical protein